MTQKNKELSITLTQRELDAVHFALDYVVRFCPYGKKEFYKEVLEKIAIEASRNYDIDSLNECLKKSTGVENAWVRNSDGTASYAKREEVFNAITALTSQK